MAKTRAEIQKAYRERKKMTDPMFLTKEKLRQTSYRQQAAERSKKKQAEYRRRNKMYCVKYRQKKKEQKQAAHVLSEQVNDVSSTSTSSEVTSSTDVTSSMTPQTRSTGNGQKLLVRLPLHTKSLPSKRRSKALRKARSTILELKSKVSAKEKLANKWRKRFERNSINKSKVLGSSAPEAASSQPSTPRSKTKQELKEAGMDPRKVPRQVVRKLEAANVMIDEIKAAHTDRANDNQKSKRLIKTLISGKILKRYRQKNYMSKQLGIPFRYSSQRSESKALNQQRRQRQPAQQNKLATCVTDFFERDDVSQCMPGKRDSAKVNGEKKQIRILNDYLSNLYEKFCTEETTMKLSFSSFCKLRPKNVKVTSLLSRNTCLCTIHQNMALKLKCLRSLGIDISPNPEVVKKIPLENIKAKLAVITAPNVENEEWRRVEVDGKKKMRIVKVCRNLGDFVDFTTKQFEIFLERTRRVTAQYKALGDLKKKLPEGHVLVQMDFAENFTCQTMDEIQSAYWNATSVTIHPVVAYMKSEEGSLRHKNYAFISDVNNHNSNAVFTILRKLVPEIKQNFPQVKTIHYWTDSPSSQYWNRFIFDILTRHMELFGTSARWDYFEAGHGKGPCDGIGGTCKRRAAEAVKQGKTVIQDASEFYAWAHENEKSIAAHFYSVAEYDSASKFLAECAPRSVPGTMKAHAACPTQDGNIKIREVSCYCNDCLTGFSCGGWVEHKVRVRTEMAEEDGAEETSLGNVVSVLPVVHSTNTNTEVSSNEELGATASIYSVDLFVAAQYDGDWYIGQVKEGEDDDHELFLAFMTKHSNKGQMSFRWPARPDELFIQTTKVLCGISPPVSVGRSGRFYQISDTDTDTILGKWGSR